MVAGFAAGNPKYTADNGTIINTLEPLQDHGMEMTNNVQDMIVQKNGETQILLVIKQSSDNQHIFLEIKTRY